MAATLQKYEPSLETLTRDWVWTRSSRSTSVESGTKRRDLEICSRYRAAPGTTDQQYVIGLVRATGVLCVHGSGFGTRPEDGYFRVVFLAAPADLAAIFADIEGFTREFLAGH